MMVVRSFQLEIQCWNVFDYETRRGREGIVVLPSMKPILLRYTTTLRRAPACVSIGVTLHRPIATMVVRYFQRTIQPWDLSDSPKRRVPEGFEMLPSL